MSRLPRSLKDCQFVAREAAADLSLDSRAEPPAEPFTVLLSMGPLQGRKKTKRRPLFPRQVVAALASTFRSKVDANAATAGFVCGMQDGLSDQVTRALQ